MFGLNELPCLRKLRVNDCNVHHLSRHAWIELEAERFGTIQDLTPVCIYLLLVHVKSVLDLLVREGRVDLRQATYIYTHAGTYS